ncbi:condensation domain-containing protein, partial [Arenibaculum sp.]|uniref:condensation domain-containing protein n=1 Tax=Arenibaculum sp. TaxID=2865862 RepID=UPI002E167A8D|nr:condensation domain-containing protein [Arenibaculum sp.]
MLRDLTPEQFRALRKQSRITPLAHREELLAPSFAQQRLWFVAQVEGGSEAYHMPIGLRLRGRLDEAALKRALDRLVARHEALRTTFVAVEGEPFQRVAPADIGFDLRRHDLTGRPGAE